VGVCVDKKTLSDEDVIADLLKAFLKANAGIPGQLSPSQRKEMRELLKRPNGRETFFAAGRAWLKASPWDARTTHPFASFISGYEGYAGVKQYDDNEKKRRDAEPEMVRRATELHQRKAWVSYGSLREEFFATLTQEDRDYIAAVAAAPNTEVMPPDNGRRYVIEELEFFKKQREATTTPDDF